MPETTVGGVPIRYDDYAEDHPWFHVRRLDTLIHFPTLEAPQAVAAAVDSFAG
jgi:pimeloyl-ACP methyl ester carboxylesterase